ncbi:MAG: hypothetical protein ACYDC6_08490 [Acidobacteriaceae bacterium]
MRKQLIGSPEAEKAAAEVGAWLDLEVLAEVELTSEDPQFPVEGALSKHRGSAADATANHAGWRAAAVGPQTLRFRFNPPQMLRKVRLRFVEENVERSQEFVLRCVTATGAVREIVRQQWTFSPGGSSQEIEEYSLNQDAISVLELVVDPDRGRYRVCATLAELQVA